MSVLAPEAAAPRLVRAVAASVAPVPPLATATVPVTFVAFVADVADVAVAALPPIERLEAVPVRPAPDPLNWVAVICPDHVKVPATVIVAKPHWEMPVLSRTWRIALPLVAFPRRTMPPEVPAFGVVHSRRPVELSPATV